MIMILFVYQKHFLICLFEMMMKERINIKGYNLLQVHHPSNKKRGGVCLCYKEHLPKRDDLRTLKECLVTEIRVHKKSFSFRVCIDHQIRLKMNLRSFVMT